jgi:hypothetical protein
LDRFLEDILGVLRAEWTWAIPEPKRILAISKLGNVLVTTTDGSVWHIVPEEWACRRIADDERTALGRMIDPQFRAEWEMADLVARAEARDGVQPFDRCFCLKLPAVVGGKFELSNVGTITILEHLAFCGGMAFQIRDVPDGEQIVLKFRRGDGNRGDSSPGEGGSPHGPQEES